SGSPRRGRTIDQFERSGAQLFSQRLRVADSRRRRDHTRTRAVPPGTPPHSPNQVSEVSPKGAAIQMDLINDDQLKPAPESLPPTVLREQVEMHHLRIGNHELRI